MLLPGAVQALQAFHPIIEQAGLPPKIAGLAHLRASQINGCSVCLDLHRQMVKKLGETDERQYLVAGWREAPCFTPAERAALALTEAVTRLADRADPVPDDIWSEAARHFDERQLAALVLSISITNLYNRINVATRQLPGPLKW